MLLRLPLTVTEDVMQLYPPAIALFVYLFVMALWNAPAVPVAAPTSHGKHLYVRREDHWRLIADSLNPFGVGGGKRRKSGDRKSWDQQSRDGKRRSHRHQGR